MAEILVASGLGIVVSMFAMKSLNITVQNAHIIKTDLEAQALSKNIQNFLSNEPNCKSLLKPANLAEGDDRDNQKGLLLNSSGTALKQIGDFKLNLLSIEGLKLMHEGVDKSYPKRTLAVFYKKPYLREQATLLSDEDCDPANNKLLGCYLKTCVLDYKCSNDDCNGVDNKCVPLSCHSGKSEVQSVSCAEEGPGFYLESLTAGGEKVCKPIHPCQENEAYLGVYKETETIPEGNEVGDPKCMPLIVSSSLLCPEGQIVKRIKKTGELECTGLCGKNQRWDHTGNRCTCMPGSRLFNTIIPGGYVLKCLCDQGKEISNGECKCPIKGQVLRGWGQRRKCQCPYQGYIVNNECRCAEGASLVPNSLYTTTRGHFKCQCDIEGQYSPAITVNGVKTRQPCRCRYYRQVIINNRCECPRGATVVGEYCECPAGQGIVGRACQRCPEDAFIADGKCKCPRGGVVIGNRCECPRGATVVDNRCQCPEGSYIANNRCQCRYSGQTVIDGTCRCPTGTTVVGNSCQCPDGTFRNNNGSCQCRYSGQILVNGTCQCPSNKPHFHSGGCRYCPFNKSYRYDNDCHRCPKDKPYYYKKSSWGHGCWACPSGQTLEKNFGIGDPDKKICCPEGNYINYNGHCCPLGGSIMNYSETCCVNSGRNWINGICCSTHKYWDDGICCDREDEQGRRWYNSKGHCCPEGAIWVYYTEEYQQKSGNIGGGMCTY